MAKRKTALVAYEDARRAKKAAPRLVETPPEPPPPAPPPAPPAPIVVAKEAPAPKVDHLGHLAAGVIAERYLASHYGGSLQEMRDYRDIAENEQDASVNPAAAEKAEDCGCNKTPPETNIPLVSNPIVANERPEVAPTIDHDGPLCRPFTRIERDPVLFRACMARAAKVGPLKDSASFYRLVAPEIVRRDTESFFVVCSDFRGQLRDFVELAVGQKHSVHVDLEDIWAVVLVSRCDYFAVAHCHPTGHAKPSTADGKLTAMVRRGQKIACPKTVFVDHIVIGSDQYYSFADETYYKR